MTTSRSLRRLFFCALAWAPLLSACHDEASTGPAAAAPPAGDDALVALYFDAQGDALAHQGPALDGVEKEGKSFYLAVRKNVLADRWFLSAYLKQFHPDGGGFSIGTRVVSFRVQNGKLFVFDVDDRKTISDTLDPEVVLEAYPLVDPKKLGNFADRDQYVVFDPSAGLNRFSVINEIEIGPGLPAYPSRLETEVSYAQNFHPIAEGVAFEQVFSGYFDRPDQLVDAGEIEPNPFRAAGTLALSLRRYREGKGYAPKPMPAQELYFQSAPRLVPNGGFAETSAVRWALPSSAAPIKWLISPSFAAIQQELAPEVDLVGAIKRGIESWNDAFGFEALTAELASPEQSFADDDVNYLLLDESAAAGFAFADFRLNPNTGEVRGANVYFGGGVVYGVLSLLGPPGAARMVPSAPPPARFAWGDLTHEPLCALDLGAIWRESEAAVEAPSLTPIERVERFLSHFAAHEVGHTLGLRHNFKGSLVPPSSSSMDYLAFGDAVNTPGPGTYDVDAIRYLYDLAPEPPAQPFCTDEQVALDPLCNRFDRRADPLGEYLAPFYQDVLGQYLAGGFPPEQEAEILQTFIGVLAFEVLDFVRAPGVESATRKQAWDDLYAPVRGPLDPSFVPAKVDTWTRQLIDMLVFGPSATPGFSDTEGPPARDPLLDATLAADLGAVVTDPTALFDITTKIAAVDALEALQAPEALAALNVARASLGAQLPSLEGAPADLTRDLIARIDRATSPYFD
jgi:Met-zincin